jgi:hypothetical protein
MPVIISVYADDKEFHILLFYLIRLLLKFQVFWLTLFLQARDVTGAYKMADFTVQKITIFTTANKCL